MVVVYEDQFKLFSVVYGLFEIVYKGLGKIFMYICIIFVICYKFVED